MAESNGVRNPFIQSQLTIIRWWAFGISGVALVVAVFALYMQANTVNQLVESQRQTQELAYKLATVSAVTTSTPLPQTSVPVIERVNRFNLKTTFSGYTLDIGSFVLNAQLVADHQGKYTKEEGRDLFARISNTLIKECGARVSQTAETLHLSSRSSDPWAPRGALSSQCWTTLEQITGQKPKTLIPAEVLTILKSRHSIQANKPNTRFVLFVSEDGRIIGHHNWAPLPNIDCIERGLRAIKRDGTPYFMVDLADEKTHEVFYYQGLIGTNFRGMALPDLCESANMLTGHQMPSWLKHTTSNSAHEFTVEGMVVRVHFKGEEGRYLLELNGRPLGTVGKQDLILINRGWADPLEMYYFSLDEETILPYKPAGNGGYAPGFQSVPTIWFNPMVDGIRNYVSWTDQPSPYIVNGDEQTIVHQNPFKEWNKQ